MSGITLGHFLIGAGLLDAVLVPLMARSVRRANPDAPAGGIYLIVAAGLVSAVALCLLGLYLPQAQIQVL